MWILFARRIPGAPYFKLNEISCIAAAEAYYNNDEIDEISIFAAYAGERVEDKVNSLAEHFFFIKIIFSFLDMLIYLWTTMYLKSYRIQAAKQPLVMFNYTESLVKQL